MKKQLQILTQGPKACFDFL
jgi:hypothetical protein